MTLNVRRIVTGHDANGKAVVASDERISAAASPTRPGISRVEIWSTDKMPVDNSEGAAAEAQRKGFVVRHNYVGSGQGSVVRITEFAPGSPPFMHRTETLDYAILLIRRVRPRTRRRQDRGAEAGRYRRAARHDARLGQHRQRAVRFRLRPDRRRSGRDRRAKADDALPGSGRRSGAFFLTSPALDRRLRGAQIAAAGSQRRPRVVDADAFEQQQRQLDAAIGLAQRLAHAVGGHARSAAPASARCGARACVRRLHIDHQPLIDMPEPDHHQRRQQGQRDTLRGAGLHAGRAGDRLGAGIEPDRVVGFVEDRRVRVVGDADGQRPARSGFAQTAERERRRAAGRDRDQRVPARRSRAARRARRPRRSRPRRPRPRAAARRARRPSAAPGATAGQPKVGISSAPSCTASRPEVPAPA